MNDDATGPSIVVTGGGEPSPEELAALVIALTPVAGGGESDEEVTRPRGWQHAALIEGAGGRPPHSYPDLVSGRFGLGHVGHPQRHA